MGFATIAATVGSALVSKALNRGNDKAARDAMGAQTNLANQQAQIAQEQYDDWKNDFLPLQHDLVREARGAGSQMELDNAAEKANADVTQAFGRGKAELAGRLSSLGIDPSQGRFATTFGRYGLGEAAASAGAQNTARQSVMDKAWGKKLDVYGMGRGIPAQAGAGLGAAAAMQGQIGANAANASSRNAMGIGSLFQQAVPAIQKWWNTPSTSPTMPGGGMSGYDPTLFGG